MMMTRAKWAVEGFALGLMCTIVGVLLGMLL